MNRPVTTNNEVWYAVDLKIVVMTKNSDPRSGEHIRRLTKISRAQPDYSFFQPPPDYTIQDETGTFTITISRP